MQSKILIHLYYAKQNNLIIKRSIQNGSKANNTSGNNSGIDNNGHTNISRLKSFLGRTRNLYQRYKNPLKFLNIQKQTIDYRFPSGDRNLTKLTISNGVKRIFNPNLINKHVVVNSDSNYKSLPLLQKIFLKWRIVISNLLPLGGNSEGNSIAIYSDGNSAFNAIWNAIESAKYSIQCEVYILEPDYIGIKTMNLLSSAAKRGCDVTLLYDAWGSTNLLMEWKYLEELKFSGVKVVQFNPFLGLPWRKSFLFRNHRKILIIDNLIGFCGGMNISNDYAGILVGGNGKFRDTHLQVQGPAVLDLLNVFNDSLQEAFPAQQIPLHTNKITFKHAKFMLKQLKQNIITINNNNNNNNTSDNSKSITTNSNPADVNTIATTNNSDLFLASDLFIQVLKSNVWRNSRAIQRSLVLTLESSLYNCYITNPYFMPPYRLRKAILKSAKSGVDIRILMSGEITDVPLVRWASYHIYESLILSGVKIYELTNQTLHAKTITIDGIYSSIGSFNFDRFSSAMNLEVSLTILDPITAKQLEKQFFKDLENSKQLTLEMLRSRTLLQRIGHLLAYYLLKVLTFPYALFPWTNKRY